MSGHKVKELGKALVALVCSGGKVSSNFSLRTEAFKDGLAKERHEGVERSDKKGWDSIVVKSLAFRDAPHAAIPSMPSNMVRVTGDVGIYAQSSLL